jgi:hypothetical protein
MIRTGTVNTCDRQQGLEYSPKTLTCEHARLLLKVNI